MASSVTGTEGVTYVPALLGLGTPRWDYGARGALLGLTRGSVRAHIVRAVLEGVAERGADLVDAAEADCGLSLDALRVDGGMSVNSVFVQHLADATQRPVEVSPVREATTLGAGFLAGLAVGMWVELGRARSVVEARITSSSRERRRIATAGGGGRPRPRTGTRTSPPWTSELRALCVEVTPSRAMAHRGSTSLEPTCDLHSTRW